MIPTAAHRSPTPSLSTPPRSTASARRARWHASSRCPMQSGSHRDRAVPSRRPTRWRGPRASSPRHASSRCSGSRTKRCASSCVPRVGSGQARCFSAWRSSPRAAAWRRRHLASRWRLRLGPRPRTRRECHGRWRGSKPLRRRASRSRSPGRPRRSSSGCSRWQPRCCALRSCCRVRGPVGPRPPHRASAIPVSWWRRASAGCCCSTCRPTGSHGNRYLALYHQGHLWLGMLTLSVLVFLRQPIGRGLAWMLSIVDGVASGVGARLGAGGRWRAAASRRCSVGAFGALLANMRQLTSELGRIWLIVGAAWFFFLRGTPLAERLARSGTSFGSLARYVWPLAVRRDRADRRDGGDARHGTAADRRLRGRRVPGGVDRDVVASAHRATTSGATRSPSCCSWPGSSRSTHALFRARRDRRRHRGAASRISRRRSRRPTTSSRWSRGSSARRHPPASGSAPCRGAATAGRRGCAGVPAQIQSDYTFTAMVGAFGWTAAWALTLGCAIWLHRLVRHHGRVTRGEPRLVRVGRAHGERRAGVPELDRAWPGSC